MPEVQGHCDDRFESLRQLFQEKFDNGEELGASLAVSIDGNFVVDLWGGYADEGKGKPWQQDTIAVLWSTTKTATSLAALMLVERELIDLDETVSKYWPEFGTNGKEDITVRQLISNTAGVPAWEKPVAMEDLYDVDKASARLAQQEPWWTPGTRSGYHGFTHGHLISQLVRRTTGKTLKDFIAEELAAPLGADFQLGVLPKDYERVASMVPPPDMGPMPKPLPGSIMDRFTGAPAVEAGVETTTGFREAEIGSANGHSNGRSIAKVLSPIALGGTVDGVKILSPRTIDEIFKVQAHGEDLVMGIKLCFGTGYGMPAKDTFWDWIPCDGRICGWGGWGGSMAIVDVDRRMTVGYAMNKMQNVGLGSTTSRPYLEEVYKILRADV